MKAHANNAEAIGPEVIDTYLIAAALQQPHRIRYYIEHLGLHPDTTRDGKPTALCYASLKPNIVLIDYYLEKGANVNHADAIGMTPLHYAAMGDASCASLGWYRKGRSSTAGTGAAKRHWHPR